MDDQIVDLLTSKEIYVCFLRPTLRNFTQALQFTFFVQNFGKVILNFLTTFSQNDPRLSMAAAIHLSAKEPACYATLLFLCVSTSYLNLFDIFSLRVSAFFHAVP